MPTVLIVEDNLANIAVLSINLQDAGFSILVAEDGATGVSVAYNDLPDLILMDMSLPLIDGWQCAQILKANRNTRDIPIIALTAHAMSGDRQRCLDAGCDEYEAKPVDFPHLRRKMDALLAAGERRALQRARSRRRRRSDRIDQLLITRDEQISVLKSEIDDLLEERKASMDSAEQLTAQRDALRSTLAAREHELAQLSALTRESVAIRARNQEYAQRIHTLQEEHQALQALVVEQDEAANTLQHQHHELARQHVLLKAYISQFGAPETPMTARKAHEMEGLASGKVLKLNLH